MRLPRRLLGAALWAVNPTILYNSAYWGQTDSIMLFLLALAFSLLDNGRVKLRDPRVGHHPPGKIEREEKQRRIIQIFDPVICAEKILQHTGRPVNIVSQIEIVNRRIAEDQPHERSGKEQCRQKDPRGFRPVLRPSGRGGGFRRCVDRVSMGRKCPDGRLCFRPGGRLRFSFANFTISQFKIILPQTIRNLQRWSDIYV